MECNERLRMHAKLTASSYYICDCTRQGMKDSEELRFSAIGSCSVQLSYHRRQLQTSYQNS